MVRKSHAIPKQDRKKQVYDMMGNIRLQSQRDHKCQCPFCHAKVLFFCWSNMGSILAWSPDWLNACFYDLDSTFHSSNHIKSPSLLSDFLFISDISTAKPPWPLDLSPPFCHDAVVWNRSESASFCCTAQCFLASSAWSPNGIAHNGMPWDAGMDKWWNQH